MKEFFILKVLDLFKSIYENFGVNYKVMRLIVQSKLVMDGRRTNNNINVEEGKDKNYFLTSLLIYGMIGLFSAPIIIMNVDPVIKMSLYFGFFMIMVLSVFISDFSNVILDINDKDILSTKGVDDRTLNAAKITHVFIYISMLSLSIGLGALIASLRYGIMYFLLLLVSILFIDVLMIIITAFMYLLILRFFNGEKLKDIISIFQVGFILLFTIGYQVIIRAFNFIDISFTYSPKLWNIFMPPMWFGANFNILQDVGHEGILRIMSILSITVPIFALIIYIYLIPMFEYNLQKLNDNTYKNTKTKESLTFKLSKLICKNKEERVFFNFVYNILKKDRDFKTKIYPSLAIGALMPIIMIASMYDGEGLLNYIKYISSNPYYMFGYMSVLMSQTIITTLKFSNQYEGAWIYDVLPIKSRKNIYTGMFKAFIYKLIVPIFIMMSIVFIILFNVRVIPHLIIIFLATIVTCMLTFKFNDKQLPFTSEYKNTNSSENIITIFKSMFCVGILVIIHILINKSIIFTFIYLALLLLFIKISWNKVFNV